MDLNVGQVLDGREPKRKKQVNGGSADFVRCTNLLWSDVGQPVSRTMVPKLDELAHGRATREYFYVGERC